MNEKKNWQLTLQKIPTVRAAAGESDQTYCKWAPEKLTTTPAASFKAGHRLYNSHVNLPPLRSYTFLHAVKTGHFKSHPSACETTTGTQSCLLCLILYCWRSDERFRVGCSSAVTAGGWTTTNVALYFRKPGDGRGLYNVFMWWASWWVAKWDLTVLVD